MKTSPSKTAHQTCYGETNIDPRVRRTRELLENAFRTLIREKSFSSLSVQDITDYATVNRATFYAHYSDKEALASSVLRNDLRSRVRLRFPHLPPVTPENLVEVSVIYFEFLEAIHGNCPKTGSELAGATGNPLQEELFTLLEHWLSKGDGYLRMFPDTSKTMLVTVLSWSIYGSAWRWLRAPHREPARQVCRELIALFISTSR